MPTQDETPTVEIEPEPILDVEMITGQLNLWRARYVLAREGVGERTVETCTLSLDRWLDVLSDALLEQQLAR
jgi:hypothetical protein